MLLPQFRQDLQVTKLADELLVFDPKENKAHCFNLVGSVVFQACQEKNSAAELLAKLSQLNDVVDAQASLDEALASFAELGLLSIDATSGLGRREFLSTGGKAVAGVLVASTLAPTPASAQSNGECQCASGTQAPQWLTASRSGPSGPPGYGNILDQVEFPICIGTDVGSDSNPPRYVWLEPNSSSEITFDETITFTIRDSGLVETGTGCFSSWEQTFCDGCQPNGAGTGQNNDSPTALNISRLFPRISGNNRIPCGVYYISAYHCNSTGAKAHVGFSLSWGDTLPVGAYPI